MSPQELIEDILKMSENIYNAIPLDLPPEWLNSDLTVAQLQPVWMLTQYLRLLTILLKWF